MSITVNDASGATQTVNTLPALGQAAGSGSLPVVLASDALAEPGGAAITGAAMPAGGTGLTGWLSAIWSKLSGTLAVTGAFYPASQPTTETYASGASNQVSVATTATLICAARAGRKEVTIVNHSTIKVFLGVSGGVTAATGILLAGVEGSALTITGGAAIYGVTASGSETVSYLEVY